MDDGDFEADVLTGYPRPTVRPSFPETPTGEDDPNIMYYPPDGDPPRRASYYNGRANIGYLHPSQDSLRIRWPVFGELSDIQVLDDPRDTNSATKPYLNDKDGSFHAVSDSAVTDPPCSQTTIYVDCLNEYSSLTFENCDCPYVEPDASGMVAADPVVQCMSREQLEKSIERTRKLMQEAARKLDFIEAAQLRDEVLRLEDILKEKSV